EIFSPRDAFLGMKSAAELPKLLHLELMNRGVFSAPRGAYNISTPMTEKEVDQALEAFGATLEILKPYATEETPHLIAD
ncbi:MAG: hypothetical protein OEW09_11145, partial [Anaerolineae bacterium]|nr:hypothetical protein [Anaerolineae bacterium]